MTRHAIHPTRISGINVGIEAEDVVVTEWAGVRERVAALREHPECGKVFGSAGHHFVLEPPLSDDDIADLEATLGIELPSDYRGFLAEVGAGGAGPFYGVLPVRRTDEGWAWHGDGAELTDLDRLAEGFPIERVPAETLSALMAVQPKDGDDDLDAAFDAWDAQLEALLYRREMSVGAICLADEGGGYRDWLVVSGPARGAMWEDPRCIDEDFTPMGCGFGEWYLAWLRDAEKALQVELDV